VHRLGGPLGFSKRDHTAAEPIAPVAPYTSTLWPLRIFTALMFDMA